MASPSGGHRPHDWTPLAAADPVPGDPAAIRDEVSDMKALAKSLREQAGELRVIGHGEGLKGQYADKLRSGAMELEKHLRQVAERYEHVHGCLTRWAGELEDFQGESVRLLHQARAAESDEKAAAAKHAAHPAAHPAPAGHHHADDPVHPFRVSLGHLTDHRDTRAGHYAGQISGVCDDIIKDSWWERTEDDVGDALNNKWVNLLFTIASWVVTIVGIVCLFCTPVGWIIGACAAIGFALAAKDLLAAVTGNGSWADVALDAVGILGGFALGRALKSLSAIRAATKVASEGAAADDAASQVMRDSRNALDRSHATTSSRTATRSARASARQARGAVRAQASRAGETARAAEHARPEPTVGKSGAVGLGGDTKAAGEANDIARMRSAYSASRAVQEASKHAGFVTGVAKAAWAVPAGSDLGDKFASFDEGYDDVKDRYTVGIGSQW